MANIRVVLDRPPFDGMAITFNAPCACNMVEGLTVSYSGLSDNFTFRDAHGHDLTGLGNLFEEGAYVRAILDTKNWYAYLQNADTNAYLEARLAEKGVEDSEHSGCYYRLVNGEKEWLNPPLEDAGEVDEGNAIHYRTTKRFFNKPVYVQAGTLASYPTVSQPAYFKVGNGGDVIENIVSVRIAAKNKTGDYQYEYPLPFHVKNGELRATFAKTGSRTFGIFAHGSDMTDYTFTYCIEYTKV